MKYVKYVLLAGLLVTVAFLIMRESGGEHDHAHGFTEPHGPAGTAHTQETDDPAHTHESGEPQPHEAGNAAPAHETGEPQPHEAGDPAHTHESGGIPVDGNWEALIGLETVRVIRTEIEEGIPVPGRIVVDPERAAEVSPFVEASVNCVFAKIGDRVKAGDELACLTSPQIGLLRAEFDKARAELAIAEKAFARKKKLFVENIISEKAWQEAELARNVAEVNYHYARKRLLAIGIGEDEIDNPPTGHSDAEGSTIHMLAPVSGVITAWNIRIGQKVDHSSILFEIVNLDRIWCKASVFEKHLSLIKKGQAMKVTVTAWPERFFDGKIFFIGSTLNRETGTIDVIAEIINQEEGLKPGMYAKGRIVTGKKPDTLVLPRDAVLEDEGLNIVFIKEGDVYHRHVVTVGIEADPLIEILSGVGEGDEIVVKGNYQLKSKLKMQGVDPHAGHVH